MRAFVQPAALAFLLVTAVGCDKPPPEFNKLAATADFRSNAPAINLKERQEWARDADSKTTDTLKGLPYNAKGGITVEEGAAAIITVAPLFDDGEKYGPIHELGGALHIAGSTPEVSELQLLLNETRRYVIVAKKIGHADFTFTIDGTPGTIVVPVDIIAPKPRL